MSIHVFSIYRLAQAQPSLCLLYHILKKADKSASNSHLPMILKIGNQITDCRFHNITITCRFFTKYRALTNMSLPKVSKSCIKYSITLPGSHPGYNTTLKHYLNPHPCNRANLTLQYKSLNRQTVWAKNRIICAFRPSV